jgi:hypothetical protein
MPSSLDTLSQRFGVPVPPPRECFERSLEYWASERGTVESMAR